MLADATTHKYYNETWASTIQSCSGDSNFPLALR
jgi:hypothetical protein